MRVGLMTDSEKNQQEIEELHDAHEMLDFMIENPSIWIEAGDSEFLGQMVVGNYGAFQTQAEGATPREAIRAAMEGKKNE